MVESANRRATREEAMDIDQDQEPTNETTKPNGLSSGTNTSPSPNCTYTNNSPPVGYRSLSLNIPDGAQLSNDSGMPLDCHDYSTDSSSSNGRDEEEPAFRDSLPNTLRPTVLPSTSTLPDFTMY